MEGGGVAQLWNAANPINKLPEHRDICCCVLFVSPTEKVVKGQRSEPIWECALCGGYRILVILKGNQKESHKFGESQQRQTEFLAETPLSFVACGLCVAWSPLQIGVQCHWAIWTHFGVREAATGGQDPAGQPQDRGSGDVGGRPARFFFFLGLLIQHGMGQHMFNGGC